MHICDTLVVRFLVRHFYATSDTIINLIYTVSQKNWATFLQPITLEILNRSLPNWA